MYEVTFGFHKSHEDIIKDIIASRNGMLSDNCIDGFKDSKDVPNFREGSALFDCRQDMNIFLYTTLNRFGYYYFYVERIEWFEVE